MIHSPHGFMMYSMSTVSTDQPPAVEAKQLHVLRESDDIRSQQNCPSHGGEVQVEWVNRERIVKWLKPTL